MLFYASVVFTFMWFLQWCICSVALPRFVGTRAAFRRWLIRMKGLSRELTHKETNYEIKKM